MVPDTPNLFENLLPDRHPQTDFFVVDVADAVLKDLMPAMEHPFYALSKKPDTSIRRYEHNGKWLEVIPSAKGQATIYDKDILIFAVSQIMHKLNNGEPVERTLRFNPRELLIFVNRGTGGKDYDAFEESLDRLMGTVIKTNIVTHNEGSDIPLSDEEDRGLFHLIERAQVRRKNGSENGRIMWAEIELSEWVYNGIRRQKVLTLHRDYFRLRKPIERRVYEIARKFCGLQPSHEVGLDKLLKRTGARMSLKRFRFVMRELAQRDHLPDYTVSIDEAGDKVTFRSRGSVPAPLEEMFEGSLSPDAYEDAREAAPGWDVRFLENQWRRWCGKEEIEPKRPDAHYVRFCRSWFERRGHP
ncbi:Plasmid replication initiator protein [Roseivivax halotolerans]|uniref:Plasmid replication initiator protein n=1 Tax=Roseivivax halotolerans TaxID=93684 RepID=A0A1I6AK81_9RHOB|nr:replication initiator protein A [Roseivivax halotolerans]SFQ69099.1 Plasmid replication initiator protein [Roseivivax halotolerans]